MIKTHKANKALKVSLSESDSKYLKDTADKLGISETELLKKGLKLMLLYAESKNGCNNARLILEDDESRTELTV